MENCSVLFKRGWILCNSNGIDNTPVLKLGWKEVSTKVYTLYHDTLIECNIGRAKNINIYCLGKICDVLDFNKTSKQVVQSLADSHKNGENWKDFYKFLKRTAGSYLLFVEAAGEMYIVQDAIGTYAVSYLTSEKYGASSHPSLLAEFAGLEVSEYFKFFTSVYGANGKSVLPPGLTTAYNCIRNLTPNHILHVTSKESKRFYPDNDYAEDSDIEETINEVAKMLRGQCDWLIRQGNKIALSLSGGLDSRLSLSALRNHVQDIVCFTFHQQTNKILAEDVKVSKLLQEKFDLNHKVFKLSTEGMTDQYKQEVMRNTNAAALHSTVGYSMSENLGEDRLHIKSIAAEICTAYFTKNKLNRPKEFTPEKLARIYKTTDAEHFAPFFADFIYKTEFNLEKFRGYHFTDMYFWEHRVGIFHSNMIRKENVGLEVYSLFSCRLLLEKMLRLPFEYRVRAGNIIDLIRKMWPELLEVPVQSGSKYIEIK